MFGQSQPISLPQSQSQSRHEYSQHSMASSVTSTFDPASFARQFLGSPMSWRSTSYGMHSGSLNSSSTDQLMNGLDDFEREGELCRDYSCCGEHLPDLHALLEHFEQVHIILEPTSSQSQIDPQNSFNPIFGGPSTSADPNQQQTYSATHNDSALHRDYMEVDVSLKNDLSSLSFDKQHGLIFGGSTSSGPFVPLAESTAGFSTDQDHEETLLGKDTVSSTSASAHASASSSAASPSTIPRPFKCPKPHCIKAYKTSNGLKYHMTHGICNFAPPTDVKEPLEKKFAHSDLSTIPEAEVHDVEREAEMRLRPFACGVGDCTRRYKNINGLRYHYQHSGEHGAVGLALLAQNLDLPDSALPNTEPADSSESLSSSLSSVTTDDLTGYILRDSEYPVNGGGYADVYKGLLKKDEKEIKVAVKVIRAHTYTPANQWKIDKRLRREIRLWSCLRHPNVVPLLGTTMSFGTYTAMVCPWMNDGNLNHYLNDRKPELNLRKRLDILTDIVEGLVYLHSQPVIHGDLTTGNILMDGGRAHLSDFGLSNVMADVRSDSFLSSTVAGAPRWTAPELIHSGTESNKVQGVTKYSDIYSFGSVALHVISGRIPYEDITSDIQVLLALIKGSLPPRPAEPLLSDGFWEFIVLCWSKDPLARPGIETVRTNLFLLYLGCSEKALAGNVVDADKKPHRLEDHHSVLTVQPQ